MKEAHWFIGELKKRFKLQVEGPFPQGPCGNGEELSYLKKTYAFTEEGILMKPNKTIHREFVETVRCWQP